MHFRVKKTLKNNCYYTFQHSLRIIFLIYQMTTTFIIIFNKFHSVFFLKWNQYSFISRLFGKVFETEFCKIINFLIFF
jgi:hypothetical protein